MRLLQTTVACDNCKAEGTMAPAEFLLGDKVLCDYHYRDSLQSYSDGQGHGLGALFG